MGWEYHRRQRGRDGRFASSEKRKKAQLHLRMSSRQADVLRMLAVKSGMGLSEYVLATISAYYDLRRLYNRERRKNGYHREKEGNQPG